MRTHDLHQSYIRDLRTRLCRSIALHCCPASPPAIQRHLSAGTGTTKSFRWETHDLPCLIRARYRLQVSISAVIYTLQRTAFDAVFYTLQHPAFGRCRLQQQLKSFTVCFHLILVLNVTCCSISFLRVCHC